MKFNRYLICALFLVLICCIGAASAAEAEDVVAADDAIDEEVTEAVDVSDEIDEDSLGVSEEPALSDGEDTGSSEYVIWVGPNTEDGNGSESNPFSNFDLACNDISTGKNNVTINVLEGNYLLNDLTFNCSNLHINGFGNVVIKNGEGDKHGFDLVSNQSTFVLSNIIIDYSDWTVTSDMYTGKYFYICKGNPNCTIFNNCTFLSYYGPILVSYNNQEGTINIRDKYYFFNNCNFIATTVFARMPAMMTNYVTFKNCMFSWNVSTVTTFSNKVSARTNTPIFEDCWFGVNKIPEQFHNAKGVFLGYDINRYAMFSISETFLGDNTYEIIGKLSWNDTTTDGIENFNPMVVNLNSTTGDIPTTVILENGTFKVIYSSAESSHKITATLDNEVQFLEFQSVDVVLDVPSIVYGDNQNITVTLPEEYNGVVYLTVNNKTYKKDVEFAKIVTVDIPDILPVGTHEVNVKFVDKIDNETCAIYGFNITTITVSKVSEYEFNANITPYKVYVGDNATITLSLPNDANGTVTVKIGDNEAKTFNVNETITIDGFVAGNNVVNITYNGNDIYDTKSIVRNISALNKPAITIPEINAGKATTTNITLPENATGNITVTVDEKDYIFNVTNGSATITIPELSAGKHNITISYSGDDIYAGFSQTSAVEVKEPAKPTPKPDDQKPATTKKTATKITAKKKTFKAKTKVKKYTITLKAGKKAVKKVQVILKIGKKTYKAKTNAKGKATFKIKKLTKKGKYTAKITFKGNKLYKATNKKVKITVKK